MEPEPSTMTSSGCPSQRRRALWLMDSASRAKASDGAEAAIDGSASANPLDRGGAHQPPLYSRASWFSEGRVRTGRIREHAMSQETLELLLTRRSAKAAMLAEPGPTPDQLDDHSDRGRPRARPQEARALALHRVRGRGARRFRPRAARRPAPPRRRSRRPPPGSRPSARGCCARRPWSPSSRA